jgi:molecular chaperone DnaK (HSP70)
VRREHGIGVEILGRQASVLLPPGTHAHGERPFTTVADGQRAVEVRVVRCAGSGQPLGLIGRFVLAGFRPGPRGQARIDIGVALEDDGIVRAWARDRDTGAREECVFPVTSAHVERAALLGDRAARARGAAAPAVAVPVALPVEEAAAAGGGRHVRV